MQLDKDTIIGDILDRNPGCEGVLASMGMHCSSCPAARGETIREACEIHDIDVDTLLTELAGYCE